MNEALQFWIRYAETLEARSVPLERERALLRSGLDRVEDMLLHGDLSGAMAEIPVIRREVRVIEDNWLAGRATVLN